jgi:hypothetical protein
MFAGSDSFSSEPKNIGNLKTRGEEGQHVAGRREDIARGELTDDSF